MTSHDPELTSIDFELISNDLVSITITKKIGMLHIKRKLKNIILQRQSDCLEQMHDVYQRILST